MDGGSEMESFLLGTPGGASSSPSSAASSSPFELMDAMTPHVTKTGRGIGMVDEGSNVDNDSGKENSETAASRRTSAALFLQQVMGSESPPDNLLNSPLSVNTQQLLVPTTPKLSSAGPTWSSRKTVAGGSHRLSSGKPGSSRGGRGALQTSNSLALSAPGLGKSQKFRVVVRVRPFLPSEVAARARRVLSLHGGAGDQQMLQIVNPYIFDADRESVAAAAMATDKKHWAQTFKFGAPVTVSAVSSSAAAARGERGSPSSSSPSPSPSPSP